MRLHSYLSALVAVAVFAPLVSAQCRFFIFWDEQATVVPSYKSQPCGSVFQIPYRFEIWQQKDSTSALDQGPLFIKVVLSDRQGSVFAEQLLPWDPSPIDTGDPHKFYEGVFDLECERIGGIDPLTTKCRLAGNLGQLTRPSYSLSVYKSIFNADGDFIGSPVVVGPSSDNEEECATSYQFTRLNRNIPTPCFQQGPQITFIENNFTDFLPRPLPDPFGQFDLEILLGDTDELLSGFSFDIATDGPGIDITGGFIENFGAVDLVVGQLGEGLFNIQFATENDAMIPVRSIRLKLDYVRTDATPGTGAFSILETSTVTDRLGESIAIEPVTLEYSTFASAQEPAQFETSLIQVSQRTDTTFSVVGLRGAVSAGGDLLASGPGLFASVVNAPADEATDSDPYGISRASGIEPPSGLVRPDGSFNFIVVAEPGNGNARSLVLSLIDGVDATGNSTIVLPISQPCVADIALPAGVLDLSDVDAFIASFLSGCP
ncbi:MAG: hypothetical protein AAGI53_01480 [Planctomycetota bacterium]